MPWPDDMREEESYVLRMIEDIREVTQQLREQSDGFDRVLRGYNGEDGLLTDLSHIERTAQENKTGIQELKGDLKDLKKALNQPAGNTVALWFKLGGMVAAMGGVIELLKYIIGGQ